MSNRTHYKLRDSIFHRKGDNWTLTDETNYLDGLGSWSRGTMRSRQQLLQDYINTAHLRQTSWIRDAVAYAEKLLKLEYGG